jgi:hypothetical protein
VRAEIAAPASLPLVVADSNDPASLAAMAEQTKALITTAGPYQLYGDGVVAACANAGTDYVDLTGESNWIADKIRDHEAEAKASGARLVFSCGFDSIPFDVGVYFTQEEAKKRFGAYAPRVRARVRGLRGGISGGSMASGMATAAAAEKNPAILGVLMNPFALTPGFTGPEQPDGNTPYEDAVAGSWVGPFMMASINSKAVHRDNFLLGHRWGQDFKYDEMTMTDGPKAPAPPSFDMASRPDPEGTRRRELRHPLHRRIFRWSHLPGQLQGRHGPRLRLHVKDARRSRTRARPGCAAHANARRLLVAGGGHGRCADRPAPEEGGRHVQRRITRHGLIGSRSAARFGRCSVKGALQRVRRAGVRFRHPPSG